MENVVVIGHSLWGVWVEIIYRPVGDRGTAVTPFGECGLKLHYMMTLS